MLIAHNIKEDKNKQTSELEVSTEGVVAECSLFSMG